MTAASKAYGITVISYCDFGNSNNYGAITAITVGNYGEITGNYEITVTVYSKLR